MIRFQNFPYNLFAQTLLDHSDPIRFESKFGAVTLRLKWFVLILYFNIFTRISKCFY